MRQLRDTTEAVLHPEVNIPMLQLLPGPYAPHVTCHYEAGRMHRDLFSPIHPLEPEEVL